MLCTLSWGLMTCCCGCCRNVLWMCTCTCLSVMLSTHDAAYSSFTSRENNLYHTLLYTMNHSEMTSCRLLSQAWEEKVQANRFFHILSPRKCYIHTHKKNIHTYIHTYTHMQLYVDITDDKPREMLQGNSKINCRDTEEVCTCDFYLICDFYLNHTHALVWCTLLFFHQNKFFHVTQSSCVSELFHMLIFLCK